MNSDTEEERFAEKYRLYGALLFRLALGWLGRPQDAEDVMQEAFIRLFTRAPAFRDAAHEKRWLLRVTINLCKNARRQDGRRLLTDPTDPVFDSLDAQERELFVLFASLPAAYKSALYLHGVAGYSVKETASLLRLTVPAVKMRLSRGRALLKKEMEEPYETARVEPPEKPV